MKLIENLKWRYATKKFDNTKNVSDSAIEKLKQAVQLSASSYGLQLYKILIIKDPEIKQKLRPASWDQSQITDCSHLFVICNYTNVEDKHVDEYISLKAETQQIPIDKLEGYSDFMKKTISAQSEKEQQAWTARQTYIALGNLLAACAELKIDACPMEGFEADKYNEILGLKSKNLNASVIAAVGYRSDEDQTQHQSKVRKSLDQLFETI